MGTYPIDDEHNREESELTSPSPVNTGTKD